MHDDGVAGTSSGSCIGHWGRYILCKYVNEEPPSTMQLGKVVGDLWYGIVFIYIYKDTPCPYTKLHCHERYKGWGDRDKEGYGYGYGYGWLWRVPGMFVKRKVFRAAIPPRPPGNSESSLP